MVSDWEILDKINKDSIGYLVDTVCGHKVNLWIRNKKFTLHELRSGGKRMIKVTGHGKEVVLHWNGKKKFWTL